MNSRKQKPNSRGARKPSAIADPGPPAWEPAKTREPIARREAMVVFSLLVVAVVLRFAHTDRISVEHWDEGVYASNLLSPGGSYPARYLYAPPLLPALIECSMLALGPSSYAAVLPNLFFGTLTVALCWWAAREWFGPAAGLAAAALAALSDFQILYSRTALTDPALCFWFLLAVYAAWRALARNRLGDAVLAGVAAGLAWATKYNGWLTLAVAVSGFLAWGLFERFTWREWFARLKVLGTIVLAAAVCWSPVWFGLKAGEYAEVTSNQAGYFVGFVGWTTSFARQAANLRFFESWPSVISIGLALVLPAIFRRRIPLLVFGAISCLAAIGTGASGFLIGPALFGPGLLLIASYRRGGTDPATRFRRLAYWLLAAWNIGLFVATPLYTAYPRLILPWLVSAWLATAAVIGSLAEPESRGEQAAAKTSRILHLRWVLAALWLVSALPMFDWSQIASRHADNAVPGWQDRTLRGKKIVRAAQTASQWTTGKSGSNAPQFLTFGEPAIFFQLASAGFSATPIFPPFDFLASNKPPMKSPTFLMAYNTPEFESLIKPYAERLELIEVSHLPPSDLVLLDKYTPGDLATKKGRPLEELRLYRVKPQ